MIDAARRRTAHTHRDALDLRVRFLVSCSIGVLAAANAGAVNAGAAHNSPAESARWQIHAGAVTIVRDQRGPDYGASWRRGAISARRPA